MVISSFSRAEALLLSEFRTIFFFYLMKLSLIAELIICGWRYLYAGTWYRFLIENY